MKNSFLFYCAFVLSTHFSVQAVQFSDKSLLYAIKESDSEMVEELLQKMNAEQINQPIDSIGQTYLMYAVKTNPEIVQRLLEKGANVHAENKQRSTALFAAIRAGDKDIIKLLLAAGANVNKQNENGDTPLLLAAIYKKPHIITLLLQHGAAPEATNKQGKSLLKAAKRSPEIQSGIDDFLVSAHTPSKMRRINKHKNEQLKQAIQAQDVFALKNLFINSEKPAINTPLDAHGRTALMYAVPGKKQIVAILLQEGALVDLQDKDKMTALMYAIEYEKPDIIQMLLDAGANCLLEDAQGNSAYTLAKKSPKKKLQELLMKHCSVMHITLPPATPSPVSDRPQSRSLFDRSASVSPSVSLFDMFGKK